MFTPETEDAVIQAYLSQAWALVNSTEPPPDQTI